VLRRIHAGRRVGVANLNAPARRDVRGSTPNFRSETRVGDNRDRCCISRPEILTDREARLRPKTRIAGSNSRSRKPASIPRLLQKLSNRRFKNKRQTVRRRKTLDHGGRVRSPSPHEQSVDGAFLPLRRNMNPHMKTP
jgi:hypothetical protein